MYIEHVSHLEQSHGVEIPLSVERLFILSKKGPNSMLPMLRQKKKHWW